MFQLPLLYLEDVSFVGKDGTEVNCSRFIYLNTLQSFYAKLENNSDLKIGNYYNCTLIPKGNKWKITNFEKM